MMAFNEQLTQPKKAHAVFRVDPTAFSSRSDSCQCNCTKCGYIENDRICLDSFLPSSVDLGFSYPVRLFAPAHASTCRGVQWLYMMVFGAGLVVGDEVDLKVEVKDRCAALLTSTSSSKIYTCAEGRTTRLHCSLTVGQNALLAVLQDPVVAYTNACYVQRQTVHMAGSSALLWLDWYSAGRVANGECWDFSSVTAMMQIFVDNKLAVQEGTSLSGVPGQCSVKRKMKEYQVFGTFIALGHQLSDYCSQLVLKFGQRKDFGATYANDVVVGCGPLSLTTCDSGHQVPGCRLTFLSMTTIQAYDMLDEVLQPLLSVLGGNPFENKS